MSNKVSKEYTTEIQTYSRKFLTRFIFVFLTLASFVFFTYIYKFAEYGYSVNGKAYHSFLDYPNEISSKEAIKLSKFMESLDMMWKVDTIIKEPFDNVIEQSDEYYWEKTINIKDPQQRNRIVRKIAQDYRLPTSKFPVHSAQGIREKLKGGLPETTTAIQQHIANPPDYLKIKQPPRAHLMECADIKKLHYDKAKLINVNPQQFGSLNILLDGLFSEGGKVSVRTATPAEDAQNPKNMIKVNVVLYAHTDDLFTHISISELEDAGTKSIHVRNHHPSALKSCLVYQMEVVFPSKLQRYKELDIKVNNAHRIEGNLKSITFSKFSVGLGRGSIKFKNLRADHTTLGTLNGIILGKYLPMKTFGAASIKGATNIELAPQSKYARSTIVALNGPVKALVGEGASLGSGFTAHCWLCIPEVESDSDPNEVHISLSRRNSVKIGYFKEICSANIQVHSRFGESKLIFA